MTKMTKTTFNCFYADLINFANEKYGTEYYFFPTQEVDEELVRKFHKDIKFDNLIFSDLESTDIWNQIYKTEYKDFGTAMYYYEETLCIKY